MLGPEPAPGCGLPPEYADFADVFDEMRLMVLPKLRGKPWDFPIKLQPGKTIPPNTTLYGMNPKELAYLRKWMAPFLRGGHCYKAPSGTACGTFMIKKPDGIEYRICNDYRLSRL